MFTTVTEVIDGTIINAPAIFNDREKAEKHFRKCMKENGAKMGWADEKGKEADTGSGYILSMYYDLKLMP